MFDSKKTQLFSPRSGSRKTSGVNKVLDGTLEAQKNQAFVQAGLKKAAETRSGNNALKYSTTGNSFVDQFGKLGEYKKPRTFAEIARDCEALWAEDPLKAVKMAFYIRTITRPTDFLGRTTSITQRGAELKHEGIMRLLWLSHKDRQAFVENLWIIPILGSWKDIITMLQTDLMYHGWNGRVLPWDVIGKFLLSALGDKNTCELVKKYLPSIQTNAKCTTVEAQADNMVAKWICSLLFGTKEDFMEGKSPITFGSDKEYYNTNGRSYKKYRKLKSSGTAHEWQKLISQKKMDRIDFSKIHGRALSLLVRSKFLKRQGLQEKYTQWVKKPTTEAVKYTGYVHELFEDFGFWQGNGGKYKTLHQVPEHVRETVNKQFVTLVAKGKSEDHTTSLIVVRDTSGSMASQAIGTNMSSNAIAKALALYFSEFLEGEFADSWIEFNTDAKMHTWVGSTPVEKWFNDNASYYGSTDFQSVIQLFIKIKNQGVPETHFPKGILCISDGEFNPGMLGRTNVESSRLALRNAGFTPEYVNDFVIALWNIPNGYYRGNSGTKFETFGDVPNVYYFSGYSASTVAFLTSRIKNAAELVDVALDQEILNLVKV